MTIERDRAGSALDGAAGFPIATGELCDRYERLFTAAVNDVLRARGLLYQVLPPSIAALQRETKVAGVAFTIKGAKSLRLENDMQTRAAMLDAIGRDAVCVWDTSGDDESAQWGEVMSIAAQRRGCRGAVVDGGVRDTDKVLGLGFRVFCRYTTSNGMLGRFRITDWETPIRIAAVTVTPGDIVFGDSDGVIVVPRRLAYEVLLEAEELKAKEREVKQWVRDGVPPREVVDRGGYF